MKENNEEWCAHDWAFDTVIRTITGRGKDIVVCQYHCTKCLKKVIK